MSIDLRLVAARVAGGDAAAFRPIVDHTRMPMYRLAARRTGNLADAKDALQDAYASASHALTGGQYDGRAKIETWLYRIVTNACVDLLRKRCEHPGEGAREPRFDGLVRAEARVALRELDQLLAGLAAPACCRANEIACSALCGSLRCLPAWRDDECEMTSAGATRAYMLHELRSRFGGPPSEVRANLRVEAMRRQLDLTADQVAKVEAISRETSGEFERHLKPCHEGLEGLREHTDTRILEVLNPDQRTRFQELARNPRRPPLGPFPLPPGLPPFP